MVRTGLFTEFDEMLEVIPLNQLKYGEELCISSQNCMSVCREDLLLSEQFLENLPQVPARSNADLECSLTRQELQVALMSMENDKGWGNRWSPCGLV